MKYSEQERATAILICQVAALTHDLHDGYASVARGLGLWLSNPAIALALEAWKAIDRVGGHAHGGPTDGAAEALLRDGWLPGDPVVRLGRDDSMYVQMLRRVAGGGR